MLPSQAPHRLLIGEIGTAKEGYRIFRQLHKLDRATPRQIKSKAGLTYNIPRRSRPAGFVSGIVGYSYWLILYQISSGSEDYLRVISFRRDCFCHELYGTSGFVLFLSHWLFDM
ncbi:hypothetical protein CEXT_23111 [Caerostris extrusa]|uniref:Uncharacterized protein n=1 Tax=Caerostris extrusa TaxID=172846 RepID=A0AAV4N7C9_CAEEX|nr:hypothetical protein CEXT_23111 [Caerostris extrusa]